jgi:DNA repair protein RecO (recombination protein O)
MTILEIEAVHKTKGTLGILRKLKLAVRFSPYIQIFTKHYRHVLSEILHHSIHEEEKERSPFSF